MAQFPYLPLWTDAYLADTGHLDATESGAYLHLMMAAWRRKGCDLPNDEKLLARWSKCSPRTWRRVRPAVLAFWDFNPKEQKWTQKRLMNERSRARNRSKKATTAAQAKWLRNKKTPDADASPKHMPAPCLGDAIPITRTRKKTTITPAPEKSGAPPLDLRGSRLPADWQPTPYGRQYAAERGYAADDIAAMIENFRDHWLNKPGKEARKIDWHRAWQTWVRKDAQFSGKRPPDVPLPSIPWIR